MTMPDECRSIRPLDVGDEVRTKDGRLAYIIARSILSPVLVYIQFPKTGETTEAYINMLERDGVPV